MTRNQMLYVLFIFSLFIMAGCATSNDIREAKQETINEVGSIAYKASLQHNVGEETAEAIGETAGNMAGNSFDDKTEEKKSSGLSSIIAILTTTILPMAAQFMKG